MSSSSSLFVTGLPNSFDENEFKNLFAQFGPIERIDIPDQHGRRKTIAYVHYIEEASASAALEKLNGTYFCGRELIIQLSDKPKKHYQPVQRGLSNPSDRSRPRPPFEHDRRTHSLIKDADQYFSLPCKFMSVNLPEVEGRMPYMPNELTTPIFNGSGHQTFALTTAIVNSEKQIVPAMVYLMPLKKDEYSAYQYQNNNAPQGYTQPPQYGFPPSYPPTSNTPAYNAPSIYSSYSSEPPPATSGDNNEAASENKEEEKEDDLPSWMRA